MRQQMIDAGLWDAADPRDPSEDISAAWQVVEKMRQPKLCAQIEDSDGVRWTCTFIRWVGAPLGWECVASSIAETVPLAICRAALKTTTRKEA